MNLKKIVSFCFYVAFPALGFCTSDIDLKNKMLADLEIIKNVFDVTYAPADLLKTNEGWDLDIVIGEAKAKIDSIATDSPKDYQNIVKEVFSSTKDLNVQVLFYSTEVACLPFEVTSIQGRYYVSYIDSEDSSSEGLQIYDEIISFDGKPIDEEIENIINQELGGCHSPNFQRLAEQILTGRLGFLGHAIPQSSNAKLTVKRRNIMQTIEVPWLYVPEDIAAGWCNSSGATEKGLLINSGNKISLPLMGKEAKSFIKEKYSSLANWRKSLSSKKSAFSSEITYNAARIPHLGKVLWRSSNDDDNGFKAYLYMMPDRQKIGYISFDSFFSSNDEMKQLAEAIAYLEAKSSAMVLDIRDAGGSLASVYVVASMFTDTPIQVLKTCYKITQKEVFDALMSLNELEDITEIEDLKRNIGDYFEGFPVTLELLESLKNHCQAVVDQWNAGNILTAPMPLYGLNMIDPHPITHYTKPMMILIDDTVTNNAVIFANVMKQRNKVLFFGTSTDDVVSLNMDVMMAHPNRFGIMAYTMPSAIPENVFGENKKPLMVTPDIIYQKTVSDLQRNNIDYVDAAIKALKKLIGQKSREK